MLRGSVRLGAGRKSNSGPFSEKTVVRRIPASVSEVFDTCTSSIKNGVSYSCQKIPKELPLFSSKVAAGRPFPVDGNVDSHLDLNTHLISKPASTFFVNVSGDSLDFFRNCRLLLCGGVKNLLEILMYVDVHSGLSQIFSCPQTKILGFERSLMMLAGINDGDILIVDRSLDAKNGSIVIAVLNGELTVKRLKLEKGKCCLKPENTSYEPIEIAAEMDFCIWGVVTSAIHQFVKV